MICWIELNGLSLDMLFSAGTLCCVRNSTVLRASQAGFKSQLCHLHGNLGQVTRLISAFIFSSGVDISYFTGQLLGLHCKRVLTVSET